MQGIYIISLSTARILLPEARVGGHGYSRLVGLCVACESTHLDAIALRLQHG